MTSTLGLLVVIYSGLRQPRKFYEPAIFGRLILNDCVEVVKKCYPCQVFTQNMCSYLTPLHTIVTIGPFTKWRVDFVDCNPNSVGGN
jgi:hypothetical protein